MTEQILKGTLLASLALLLPAAGCNRSGSAPVADGAANSPRVEIPYKVVTTVGMVADIVREVAGDRAEVIGLMGAGVDPHLYKPTRNDVQQLLEADVIFYSGLNLEGRMTDTFAKVGREGKPVYPVTEEVDRQKLREPPEFAGHYDPHLWMDVSLWSEATGFVSKALSEFDPEGAAGYRERAKAYQAELAELDEYARRVISTIPRQQRYLVTAHDAFGYFSQAYDIPVKSVQGITTESEAAVSDIESLVDFLVDNRVPAVFVESSVSQKGIEAVIEGAAQRDWQVSIGGELYSDAMGPSGSYEGTYIGMIDHNATLIARALGGDAPERGFRGQLSVHAAAQ